MRSGRILRDAISKSSAVTPASANVLRAASNPYPIRMLQLSSAESSIRIKRSSRGPQPAAH
jgi:hypothetical protein